MGQIGLIGDDSGVGSTLTPSLISMSGLLINVSGLLSVMSGPLTTGSLRLHAQEHIDSERENDVSYASYVSRPLLPCYTRQSRPWTRRTRRTRKKSIRYPYMRACMTTLLTVTSTHAIRCQRTIRAIRLNPLS